MRKLPFVWDFSEDGEDGWRVVQQIQNLGIEAGLWQLNSLGDFPVVASPGNLGINSDL